MTEVHNCSKAGRRRILLMIVLIALGLRLVYLAVSSPTDDAYISYRYARNLAAGQGFVYNTGDRVLGTTTALFTLMLVPAAWARLPLDGFAIALALLADLGACLLLYRLASRRLGVRFGLLAAFMFATFYATAAAVGYGMETPLFVLLLIASFDAADADRWRRAAVLAGLAAWTRPEGYLIAGLLLCARWIRSRRIPIQFAATFLITVAPWLIFATAYFGSPIPQSIVAKYAQEGIRVRQWGGFFFWRNPLVGLLWISVPLGAVIAAAQRVRGLALLVCWAVVYSLFFLVGRPSFLGAWYFAPIAPALIVPAAVGALTVGDRLIRRPRLIGGALAATWALVAIATVPGSIASARDWTRLVEQVYRPMANWARDQTAPGDRVFAADIGYLGYVSHRRIIDASALVTPQVTRYYQQRRRDPYRDIHFVLDRLPEVVLVTVARDNLTRFRDGGLAKQYEPVASFHLPGPVPDAELEPAVDPGPAYAKSPGFQPHFIAYKRKPQLRSTGAEPSGPRH